MRTERVILCGTAGAGPWAAARAPLQLRLWSKHPNVFLRVEDMHRALWSPVPDALQDLLDVATYVYCADQAISRGSDKDEGFGARWRRQLRFVVAVRRPEVWSQRDVRQGLTAALSFLSEDEYDFHFEPLAEPPRFEDCFDFRSDAFGGTVEEVVLFSGGLDSLAGAAREALADRRQVLLLNHRPNPKTEPVPLQLARALAARAGAVPPVYLPVRVNKQRGLTHDTQQRTRSFLYAALGAVVASMLRLARVRFYENGVVSLNLPPSAQVIGARASRTTHPRALESFGRLFSLLAERRLAVDNPFQWLTKAQVLSELEAAGCADLIGHTRSCSHPRQASNERPHCGVCSQCIDRRFAVLAAGLAGHDPADAYRVDLLTGERAPGHEQTMLAVYAAMADRVATMEPVPFFSHYGEAARALSAGGESAEVLAGRTLELYRRHAQEVNGVIEQGITEHRRAVRLRTLPRTCLLRMVYEGAGGPEPPRQPPAAAPAALGENVFRRCGEAWQVRFAGGPAFVLVPSQGAAYLHLLLQRPGTPMDVVELAFTVTRNPRLFGLGDAGPVLDEDAESVLRARVGELVGDLERARRDGDQALLDRLQRERMELMAELEAARRFRRHPRKSGDDREKVRKAVSNALARAVRKIRVYDPRLAEHLRPPHLRRGGRPCYNPPPGLTWET